VALEDLPLLEFVHALSPDLQSPFHLGKLGTLLERTEHERDVRGLSSVATRHGKTTLIEHFVARALKRNPKREFCYFSFDADFSGKKSREIRNLAKAAGVVLSKDFDTIREWRTVEGGGLFACSVGQHVVGRGFDVIIVDDPLGSSDEADDPERRDEVDAAIRFLTTRLHPGGSILINASRFHPADPIGVRMVDEVIKWEHVEAPAFSVDSAGVRHALWPERWPLEALDRKRAELKVSDPNERTWFAQYMGDPQPESQNLFGPATIYDVLPTHAHRVVHGVDFAYTDAPGADFFSAMTGRIYGHKLYIVEVQRHRLDATLLESTCRAILNKYGRAPMWSYQSGPEIGLSRLLVQRGIPVVPMQAKYNKLVRAQKTIRRWNDGEILVPLAMNCPWQPGFLHRVSLFRGHEKDRDDEIDAVVSAADAMLGGAPNASMRDLGIQGRRPYQGFLG
jgi:predicted phage terminase large subunit-like protein